MKRTAKAARQSAQPEECRIIHPTGVYSRVLAARALGISEATFAGLVREGRLQVAQQGQRLLFLGAWLLDYLEDLGARYARRDQNHTQV